MNRAAAVTQASARARTDSKRRNWFAVSDDGDIWSVASPDQLFDEYEDSEWVVECDARGEVE